MTKSSLLATALLMLLCVSPALARDDGGFGMSRVSKVPAALGDDVPAQLAREYPDIPDFAAVEPAAGDQTPAVKDDSKKAANADIPGTFPVQKPVQQ